MFMNQLQQLLLVVHNTSLCNNVGLGTKHNQYLLNNNSYRSCNSVTTTMTTITTTSLQLITGLLLLFLFQYVWVFANQAKKSTKTDRHYRKNPIIILWRIYNVIGTDQTDDEVPITVADTFCRTMQVCPVWDTSEKSTTQCHHNQS